MKRIALYLSIALLSAEAYPEGNIPADSLVLIGKLNEFSEIERAKAEQRIAKKKVQVAAVLETHLERETKAGRLEPALAIKEVIQSLKIDSDSDISEDEPMVTEDGASEPQGSPLKQDTRWRHVFNGGNGRILVLESGKGRFEIEGAKVTDVVAEVVDDTQIKFLTNGIMFALKEDTQLVGPSGNVHWELVE